MRTSDTTLQIWRHGAAPGEAERVTVNCVTGALKDLPANLGKTLTFLAPVGVCWLLTECVFFSCVLDHFVCVCVCVWEMFSVQLT